MSETIHIGWGDALCGNPHVHHSTLFPGEATCEQCIKLQKKEVAMLEISTTCPTCVELEEKVSEWKQAHDNLATQLSGANDTIEEVHDGLLNLVTDYHLRPHGYTEDCIQELLKKMEE